VPADGDPPDRRAIEGQHPARHHVERHEGVSVYRPGGLEAEMKLVASTVGRGMVLMALTAGCGGGTDLAITTGEVVGTWTIALTEDPDCGRNNPAPTMTLNLSLVGETGATALSFQGSSWELGPVVDPRLPLDGDMDLETGRFTVELIREPPAGSPNPAIRARLAGTIIAYGALEGELDDPLSGSAGILGFGVCHYTAVGQR
jgi:hypothetical protein